MGLEAISRGTKTATFIDKRKECIQCIEHNVKEFGIESKTEIFHGDVLLWMEKLTQRERQFDLIFIDPPYGVMIKEITMSAYLLDAIDRGSLLRKAGMLFIEEGSHVQLSTTGLNHLTLISKRRVGRSQLFQYEKFS